MKIISNIIKKYDDFKKSHTKEEILRRKEERLIKDIEYKNKLEEFKKKIAELKGKKHNKYVFDFKGRFERILNRRKEKINYLETIKNLTETKEIKTHSLLSDMTVFKEKKRTRLKNWILSKFKKTEFCWVRLISHDNVDIIRRYPMPYPYIVDIEKSYYLFSPKSFRYVNGMPFLTFVDKNPFAVILNENLSIPSIDSDSLEAVQNSKLIRETTQTEENNGNVLLIVVLCCVGLLIILTIISLVNGFNTASLLKGMVPK